jgi:integrase
VFLFPPINQSQAITDHRLLITPVDQRFEVGRRRPSAVPLPRISAFCFPNFCSSSAPCSLLAEKNPERNLFYQFLWEVGASQSDAAELTAENVDWSTNTLGYFRKKTGELAQMTISRKLAAILQKLPTAGPLFPKILKANETARAAEFRRRCRLLGLEGVSLHSYRYSWAERARVAGYGSNEGVNTRWRGYEVMPGSLPN